MKWFSWKQAAPLGEECRGVSWMLQLGHFEPWSFLSVLGVLQMVLVALKSQLSKQQVAMAGSQLGSQSALQIAKVAQPCRGSADQTGGGSLSPTQIFDPFFFKQPFERFYIKGLRFFRHFR